MEKIVKQNGLKVHLVPTKKFKTNTLVFKMKSPLQKEEATIRAILPHVLQSGTNTYPSITALRTYLEDLYGATLFVDLQKKGEYHVISITIEIANEKFLKDAEPLLEKAIQLLGDILLNPKVENNSFDKNIVEAEKRTLKQRIQAVYDDKMRYANLRLVEEMCKNEPYAVPVNGYLEDVDTITAESLYTYYQKAINEDELDLYIVGDFTEDEVLQMIKQTFSFPDRQSKQIEKQISQSAIQSMLL